MSTRWRHPFYIDLTPCGRSCMLQFNMMVPLNVSASHREVSPPTLDNHINYADKGFIGQSHLNVLTVFH